MWISSKYTLLRIHTIWLSFLHARAFPISRTHTHNYTCTIHSFNLESIAPLGGSLILKIKVWKIFALHCLKSVDLLIPYTFRKPTHVRGWRESIDSQCSCMTNQTSILLSHTAYGQKLFGVLSWTAVPVQIKVAAHFGLVSVSRTKLWPPLPPQLNHCFIYNSQPKTIFLRTRTTNQNHCADESQGINSTTGGGWLVITTITGGLCSHNPWSSREHAQWRTL